MIWVWILIGFVVGEGSMAGVWYWMEKKRKRQKEVQDKGMGSDSAPGYGTVG